MLASVNGNSYGDSPSRDGKNGGKDGEDEEATVQQKCVAGYCLPLDYQKLELPIDDRATNVGIETEIMDFLTVKKLFLILVRDCCEIVKIKKRRHP